MARRYRSTRLAALLPAAVPLMVAALLFFGIGCEDQRQVEPAAPATTPAATEATAGTDGNSGQGAADAGGAAADEEEEVAAPSGGPALKLRVFGDEGEEAAPVEGGGLELEVDPALVPPKR